MGAHSVGSLEMLVRIWVAGKRGLPGVNILWRTQVMG